MNSKSLSGSFLPLFVAASVLLMPLVCLSEEQDASSATQDMSTALTEARSLVSETSAAQKEIDKLDDQTRAALREYQSLLFEIDALKKGVAQYEVAVRGQAAELAELGEKTKRTEELKAELYPLLEQQVKSLERFVELDMPFLRKERGKRIEALRRAMLRSDISEAEKYRIIAEAYEVEIEYGRSVEAYRGTLELPGKGTEPLAVDYLRIGRLGYFYRLLDKSKTFAFDKQSSQWIELPESLNSDIETAFATARKEQLPQYLKLPLNLPQEVKELS